MIDPETVELYQRDGAVCIRRLFRPEEIETLRAGIDQNLAALSPRAIVASTPSDPGRFVDGLATDLRSRGVEIIEGVRVTSIRDRGGRPVVCTTGYIPTVPSGHEISCCRKFATSSKRDFATASKAP